MGTSVFASVSPGVLVTFGHLDILTYSVSAMNIWMSPSHRDLRLAEVRAARPFYSVSQGLRQGRGKCGVTAWAGAAPPHPCLGVVSALGLQLPGWLPGFSPES